MQVVSSRAPLAVRGALSFIFNYQQPTNRFLPFELAHKVFGDEFAVEAAVLDEDFVGAAAGDDDSSEVDAGDVGFESCGIADWATVVGLVEADTELLQEAEVGVVAGEREDEVVGEGEATEGRGQDDLVLGDARDG